MMYYLLVLILSLCLTLIFLFQINKEINISIVPVISSFIFVICFIFSFTISRFFVNAYALSIAENKFVSGKIISFYLSSSSSKNNDLIFNVKAYNKSMNTISAIANDTNININQLTNNVSVCVKISYSNSLFFKDFHYKNYIVDCNQKVVNN